MDVASLPELIIDGAEFSSLDGFYEEVSRRIIPGAYWGRNLDAFNDILRGGFGTPEGGFRLTWLQSEKSKRDLGMPETIRWIEKKVTRCHPSNRETVLRDLEAARRGEGATLFDILVQIIREHGPGGRENEDNVVLELR